MADQEECSSYPSLLDFASKEAFGCDDYEPIVEDATTFLVTPEDALHTVLEKAKLLGDRVLDGKSVAVALGEFKDKRKEDFDVKDLTLKERHIWQQWKRGRGALPEMDWQFQKQTLNVEDHGERFDEAHHQGAKRKASGGHTSYLPKRKQAKSDSKSLMKITSYQQEALAELYRMPVDLKTKVEALDVRHFQVRFPKLRPLLTGLTKIVQARHKHKSTIATEEQKALESHCTSKAIFMIEKQVKWIMEEANSTVDAIQEQVTLMRGRLAALEGEEEEDHMDEMSSVEEGSIQEEVAEQPEGRLDQGKGIVQAADQTGQDAVTKDVAQCETEVMQTPSVVPPSESVRSEMWPRALLSKPMPIDITPQHFEESPVEIARSASSEKSATVSQYPQLSEEEQEMIKEQVQEEERHYVETYAYAEEQQYYEEMNQGNRSDGTVDSREADGETDLEKRYPGYIDAQSDRDQAYETYVAQQDQNRSSEKGRESSPVEPDPEEEHVARESEIQDGKQGLSKAVIPPFSWKRQAVHDVHDAPKQIVQEVVAEKGPENQGVLPFHTQSRSFFSAFKQ